jgi:hypothetical protein
LQLKFQRGAFPFVTRHRTDRSWRASRSNITTRPCLALFADQSGRAAQATLALRSRFAPLAVLAFLAAHSIAAVASVFPVKPHLALEAARPHRSSNAFNAIDAIASVASVSARRTAPHFRNRAFQLFQIRHALAPDSHEQ